MPQFRNAYAPLEKAVEQVYLKEEKFQKLPLIHLAGACKLLDQAHRFGIANQMYQMEEGDTIVGFSAQIQFQSGIRE